MIDVEKRVRVLMASNLASWGVIAVLAVALVAAAERVRGRIARPAVERLDAVEADGTPVLALANMRVIPGPTMNGKEYPRELADGRALLLGMIFFNGRADEVGALRFNGIKKASC